MAKAPKNIAASVRQRLLNLARENGRDFQTVLVAFGLERLIYRLSISEFRDRFILKGGILPAAQFGVVPASAASSSPSQSRAGRPSVMSRNMGPMDHIRFERALASTTMPVFRSGSSMIWAA